MKKFIELTPKETKRLGLDNHLFKNAEQLKNNAVLIANANKSYSCALSILISSSEEVLKAILVLLHSQDYEIYKLNDTKEFFSNHKIGNQLAELIDVSFELAKHREIWNNKNEIPISEKFLNFFKDPFKKVKANLEKKKRIEKLQNYNKLKNIGLKVEFKDKLLNPEYLVTEKEYERTKEITERLFKFYKNLDLLFKIETKNEKEEQRIKKTKENLKIFITDTIKEYRKKRRKY